MATCPECGVSSRQDPTAITVEPVFVAKPIGTFSVAGAQMKVSAYQRLQMSCRCGWKILGYIDGDHFIADPPAPDRPDPLT